VINSGGVKIHPEKVEEKIRSLFGDTRFMIHKEPDSMSGERVILYLEKGEQFNAFGERLYSSMGEMLSPIEIPKNVYLIDHFEETPTFKMIRKQYDVLEILV
jgi:O-succinylbenzoic acid--CoA ligase